jgi:hypothetical protein
MLSANRLAATGAILETRDRMEQFRASQRARIQAPAAMGALSQLDPATDPDYDVKTAGIFAQYPDAVTDESVRNFLGVQGGIFDRARAERDYAQEQADRAAAQEEERQYSAMRERKSIRMDKRATLDKRVEALPVEAQQVVENAISLGSAPKDAVRMAEDEVMQNEERNSLYAIGLEDHDIEGIRDDKGEFLKDEKGVPINEGLLDDKGRIDPRKKAKAMGRIEQDKRARELAEERTAAENKRLALLLSQYKAFEAAGDETRKNIVGREIDKIQGVGEVDPTDDPANAPTTPSSGDPILDKIDAFLPTKF